MEWARNKPHCTRKSMLRQQRMQSSKSSLLNRLAVCRLTSSSAGAARESFSVSDRLERDPCQPRTSVREAGFSNPRERSISKRSGFSPGEKTPKLL